MTLVYDVFHLVSFSDFVRIVHVARVHHDARSERLITANSWALGRLVCVLNALVVLIVGLRISGSLRCAVQVFAFALLIGLIQFRVQHLFS